MAVEYAEASVIDLINTTEFLHHIKPSLRDKFVFGIEKAKPNGFNVVFHLVDRVVKEGSDQREKTTFMLSAQYILDHEYWKEKQPE